MSNEPNAEVLRKLEEATTKRRSSSERTPAVDPPPLTQQKEATLGGAAASSQAPSGNATAKYLLIDHYFGGSKGTFWAYDGTKWYGASTGQPADEQGICQVGFASNRVDMSWDNNNVLTLVRCWKYL
jgi:hypothetical protein